LQHGLEVIGDHPIERCRLGAAGSIATWQRPHRGAQAAFEHVLRRVRIGHDRRGCACNATLVLCGDSWRFATLPSRCPSTGRSPSACRTSWLCESPLWRTSSRPRLRGEHTARSPSRRTHRQSWAGLGSASGGDSERRRYLATYFERYPGVWHHGDFAELTASGGLVISGRSDATLKPGGHRIGTAEIYGQVEQLAEVVDAIAIAQDWEGDVRIVLFVQLQPGLALDQMLDRRIRLQIQRNTSPHHVPARIVAVADIPRTSTGKKAELAVRAVVHGQPVKNAGALANPEALALYGALEALRS
jgi:acyl-CoA synthetase (AMP-forming)/AMP-acid ligase II